MIKYLDKFIEGRQDKTFELISSKESAKINFPQCTVCLHLIDEELQICEAFPKGIPMKFFAGEEAHNILINGIRFESALVEA